MSKGPIWGSEMFLYLLSIQFVERRTSCGTILDRGASAEAGCQYEAGAKLVERAGTGPGFSTVSHISNPARYHYTIHVAERTDQILHGDIKHPPTNYEVAK